MVYGASLIVTLTLGMIALLCLSGFAEPSAVTLPLGLPWLGAHFRIDALAAFFLVVVNLGGAAASLFALGYGRHEEAPQRVLPFYPAYLAAMNLVVLADDAFSFLVAWEFMSLTSWALVISHHRIAENVRAGYVYLLMASFGTLGAAARLRPARRRRRQLRLRRHPRSRIPRPRSPRWCWCSRSSAPARKPAWCRCTPGCRSRIRPRPATFPR